MKKIIIATSILLFPMVGVAEQIHVTVNGMVCAFCAQGIKKSFSKLDGVTNVDPNLDSKDVRIDTMKDGQVTDEKIKELIHDAGFEVVGITREKGAQ